MIDMTKQGKKVFLLALFLLLSTGAAAMAADTGKMTKFEKILFPRTVTCWVEGVAMDELVIGARVRMTFVCVDRKLGTDMMRLRPDGSQAAEYESVPSWLRQSGSYYMKQQGKTFFAVQFTTAKPWNFDVDKIRIGGYSVKREDVLFGPKLNQLVSAQESTVSLPSDFTDEFGIYVPSELLKPGAEIQIGYDDSLVTWTVPN